MMSDPFGANSKKNSSNQADMVSSWFKQEPLLVNPEHLFAIIKKNVILFDFLLLVHKTCM